MPRNGSGTFTLAQPAFVSGTTISSSAMNSDLSDIATALTQSVSADGQTPLTGSLKFSSGSAGTPGISFSSDSTTGIYLASAGTLGLAAGGTSVATSTSGTVTFALPAVYSGAVTASSSMSIATTLAVTGNSTFTGTVSDPRGQYTGVLLNTLTASSSASLVDTTSLTSNYSSYLILIQNLVPASSGVTLRLRFSSNGGSSYTATGYTTNNWVWNSSGNGENNVTTSVLLTGTSNGQGTNSIGLSGALWLTNPSNNPMVTGQTSYVAPGQAEATSIQGYLSAAAINAIQFTYSSGNLASGIIKIYGHV